MNYKDIIGYNKSKKITKKESKPKVNKVLENIKEEFGLVKEVGAGPEYKSHIMKISKLYNDYWDAVKDFTDLLHDKGVKKEANDLHKMFMKTTHKFNGYFAKMLRKLF